VRSRAAAGAALSLLCAAGACEAGAALTPRAQADYMLNCQGCHLPDGSGATGKVPSLRTSLAPLTRTAAGRRYLVQVPGAAQSALSDAELAQVLNWMVRNLCARVPAQFTEFTAAEVAGYRATPLVAVRATRARLLGSAP
jgi:mono/diheme cytochrome c family protein